MHRHDFLALPDACAYTLHSVHVPLCCIEPSRLDGPADESSSETDLKSCSGLNGVGGGAQWDADVDGLVMADISVQAGRLARIRPSGKPAAATATASEISLDVGRSMLLPTFVDLHTHIGAGPFPALVAPSGPLQCCRHLAGRMHCCVQGARQSDAAM